MADPSITAPDMAAPLPGAAFTVTWDDGGTSVIQWWLRIGSAAGQDNYFDSGRITSAAARSFDVTSIPQDGRFLYVTLYWKDLSGDWGSRSYFCTTGAPATGITYSDNDVTLPADGYYQIQYSTGSMDVVFQGDGGTTVTLLDGTYNIFNHTTGIRTESVVIPYGASTEEVVTTSEAEYIKWTRNVSRNPFRIVLLEIDHSAGTLHLSSGGWLSDTNVPYHDFITSDPYIEESLTDFLNIGDVQIYWPFGELLDLQWYGYECRWFYGDSEWPRSQFRQLTTLLINSVERTGPKEYRIDLMDNGQMLRRKWDITRYAYDISARSTLDDIMTEAGLPEIIYTNVPELTRGFRIDVTLTDDSILLDVIELITASVGAYVRSRQDGGIEVFIPDRSLPAFPVVTEDDIIKDSVRMIETTSPYNRVVVILEDGTRVSEDTTAPVSNIFRELEVKTYLRRVIDAEIIVAELAAYHSEPHSVWEIGVSQVASVIQVGDHVAVDHEYLQGDGIVGAISRRPVSGIATIEVTI